MIVDITLATIFIAGLFTLWYRISVKIPELIAIPDEVITARLQEDSAWIRVFILHLKIYWREERYKAAFWRIFSKVLYKFHIMLLRVDNWVTAFLKDIRASGVANGNGNGDYWKELKSGISSQSSNAPRTTRIEEVRPKGK